MEIPSDPELWGLEHFREFLEARKVLLANEAAPVNHVVASEHYHAAFL